MRLRLVPPAVFFFVAVALVGCATEGERGAGESARWDGTKMAAQVAAFCTTDADCSEDAGCPDSQAGTCSNISPGSPTGMACNCGYAGGICGNGVREPGEECEGTDLGGQSCATVATPPGILSCTPGCRFDARACGGGGGASSTLSSSSAATSVSSQTFLWCCMRPASGPYCLETIRENCFSGEVHAGRQQCEAACAPLPASSSSPAYSSVARQASSSPAPSSAPSRSSASSSAGGSSPYYDLWSQLGTCCSTQPGLPLTPSSPPVLGCQPLHTRNTCRQPNPDGTFTPLPFYPLEAEISLERFSDCVEQNGIERCFPRGACMQSCRAMAVSLCNTANGRTESAQLALGQSVQQLLAQRNASGGPYQVMQAGMTCQRRAACGNGVLEAGEACEWSLDPAGCDRQTCQPCAPSMAGGYGVENQQLLGNVGRFFAQQTGAPPCPASSRSSVSSSSSRSTSSSASVSGPDTYGICCSAQNGVRSCGGVTGVRRYWHLFSITGRWEPDGQVVVSLRSQCTHTVNGTMVPLPFFPLPDSSASNWQNQAVDAFWNCYQGPQACAVPVAVCNKSRGAMEWFVLDHLHRNKQELVDYLNSRPPPVHTMDEAATCLQPKGLCCPRSGGVDCVEVTSNTCPSTHFPSMYALWNVNACRTRYCEPAKQTAFVCNPQNDTRCRRVVRPAQPEDIIRVPVVWDGNFSTWASVDTAANQDCDRRCVSARQSSSASSRRNQTPTQHTCKLEDCTTQCDVGNGKECLPAAGNICKCADSALCAINPLTGLCRQGIGNTVGCSEGRECKLHNVGIVGSCKCT